MAQEILYSRDGTTLKIFRENGSTQAILTLQIGDIKINSKLENGDLVAFYMAAQDLLSEDEFKTIRLLNALNSYNKTPDFKPEIDIFKYWHYGQFERPRANQIKLLIALLSEQLTSDKLDADVFIGLPQKEIDLFTIERIQNATGEFMEAMNFELETKDEPVFGSFFQDLKYFFKGEGKQEAIEVYQKGKTALELQYLNLPSAEATAKLAGAAAGLIGSLTGVDEAVLRLGGILLVKVTKDGVPRIVAETVSPELAQLLDKNPKLLENPHAVFGMIAAMQATSKRIEESGTAQVIEVD